MSLTCEFESRYPHINKGKESMCFFPFLFEILLTVKRLLSDQIFAHKMNTFCHLNKARRL